MKPMWIFATPQNGSPVILRWFKFLNSSTSSESFCIHCQITFQKSISDARPSKLERILIHATNRLVLPASKEVSLCHLRQTSTSPPKKAPGLLNNHRSVSSRIIEILVASWLKVQSWIAVVAL